MPALACVDETYSHFEKGFDTTYGGFGGMLKTIGPKFPKNDPCIER